MRGKVEDKIVQEIAKASSEIEDISSRSRIKDLRKGNKSYTVSEFVQMLKEQYGEKINIELVEYANEIAK